MKHCLTLLFAATTAFAVRAETVDYIRAIVGDSVITGQQITRNVSDEIQRRGQAPDTENAAQAIWTANYQDMLRRRVVLQDFKKLEKEKNAKIPENLVNDEVEHRIHQAFSGDRVRFDKWLQANGMTRQDFHDEVRDDIVVEEMRHEFVPTPIVSPHQIQAFYEQNQEKFTVAERIKFRWIAMNKAPDETNGVTHKKMEEVLTLLKGGANFDDLAKPEDAGGYSQRLQRDPDWLETDKVNEAYRDAFSKLKPGQCSDVIETADACFILRLDDRSPGHVTPLNEVRASIADQLKTREFNRRYDSWINRLKAKILVEEF